MKKIMNIQKMKLMKRIFLFNIFFIHLFGFNGRIFNEIFNKAKPFDLSYTMTAIAKVESNFGVYKININKDGSLDCGVFMINTKTLSNNRWKQARICERLIYDFDFSFSVALERFKYFYNFWRSKGYSKAISWKRAVCSYNAGFNWKRGINYYKKIVKIIKAMKKIKKEMK